MHKVFILIVAVSISASGCPSAKVNRHDTVAYKLASAENKVKIEQGIIDEGMSIQECKSSCPECQFIKKFTSNDGNYELWKVKNAPERDLYLHVTNGRVNKVSKSEVQSPHDKKTKRQKNQ